jgi:hypothetical protein
MAFFTDFHVFVATFSILKKTLVKTTSFFSQTDEPQILFLAEVILLIADTSKKNFRLDDSTSLS